MLLAWVLLSLKSQLAEQKYTTVQSQVLLRSISFAESCSLNQRLVTSHRQLLLYLALKSSLSETELLMKKILSSFTKVEHFDGQTEDTFLLLTSQLNALCDSLFGHALNRALHKELSARPIASTNSEFAALTTAMHRDCAAQEPNRCCF